MPTRTILLILALSLALLSLPLPLVSVDPERAAARQLSDRESSLLGKLADLERQIEVQGRSLRAAQTRLRAASARLAAAEARGAPVRCRPGQFPGEELTMELLAGPVQTSRAIDDATDLATRLPATLAGMAAGLIDEARAGVIALHTRVGPIRSTICSGGHWTTVTNGNLYSFLAMVRAGESHRMTVGRR